MRLSTQGVHRRRWGTVATLVAGGLLVAGVTAPAASAVANPVAPKPAPAVIEGYTPYLPQVSCDPVVKPGTAALRALLMATYGGRDLGITRACVLGGVSEHKEGRAFDWGLRADVPAELKVATQFLTFLTAANGYNAKRLGVMYVIWNGKIWGAYRAADGWRTYTGAEAHADHIHISLAWNGAMKRTSWWTGRAAAVDYGPCPSIQGEMAPKYSGPRLTPCPAPTPVTALTGTPLLAYDAEGPYVKQLQTLLKVSPVSGWFGPLTESSLKAFQTRHGLAASGTTTVATWTALRSGAAPTAQAAVSPKYLSRLTHVVKRGESLSSIAAYWRSSVSAIQAANKLRSTSIRVGQRLVVPVKSSLTQYSHAWLHKGSRGAAVKALQTALRMPVKYRTGVFGDITKGYVNKYKTAHGWVADGYAGVRVWLALGA